MNNEIYVMKGKCVIDLIFFSRNLKIAFGFDIYSIHIATFSFISPHEYIHIFSQYVVYDAVCASTARSFSRKDRTGK